MRFASYSKSSYFPRIYGVRPSEHIFEISIRLYIVHTRNTNSVYFISLNSWGGAEIVLLFYLLKKRKKYWVIWYKLLGMLIQFVIQDERWKLGDGCPKSVCIWKYCISWFFIIFVFPKPSIYSEFSFFFLDCISSISFYFFVCLAN